MRYFLLAVFLVLSLGLTACFGPTTMPANTQYRLSAVSNLQLPKKRASNIAIMKPLASSPLNSQAMIYRQGLVSGEFSYHQWQAPVPEMLQNQIIQALIKANLFHAVVPAQFYAESQYLLKTELMDFEQIFAPGGSYFLVKINVSLLAAKNNQIIAQKLFQVSQPAAAQGPEAGVIAANLATERFLNQLINFLANNLAQQK
jgi:cholesterol transport system auxiliary component